MASPPTASRETRPRVPSDARRALILDTARAAFRELGLDGASLREIARRAGYTPGAIYSYFASKEDIYAALLSESLERVVARVDAAAAAVPARRPRAALHATATAFFDYYRENPRELDLGFYLFPGMQPRGLTPALDRALNARLRDALRPNEQALVALGFAPPDALSEATALFAHMVGLLMLGHTGRIRMFRQSPRDLHVRYVDALAARAVAARRARSRVSHPAPVTAARLAVTTMERSA